MTASAVDRRRLPPFAHLSTRELHMLGRLLAEVPVPSGRSLARQGHRCMEFGILIEGTARVTRGGYEIARLEPGETFGELGILLGVPDPFSIVTCTAVTVAVMSIREFRSAYTAMPTLRQHVDDQIDRRIATWLGSWPPVPASPVAQFPPAHEAGYTLAS